MFLSINLYDCWLKITTLYFVQINSSNYEECLSLVGIFIIFSLKASAPYVWYKVSDCSMSKITHRYIQPQGRSYMILLAALDMFLVDFRVLEASQDFCQMLNCPWSSWKSGPCPWAMSLQPSRCRLWGTRLKDNLPSRTSGADLDLIFYILLLWMAPK